MSADARPPFLVAEDTRNAAKLRKLADALVRGEVSPQVAADASDLVVLWQRELKDEVNT